MRLRVRRNGTKDRTTAVTRGVVLLLSTLLLTFFGFVLLLLLFLIAVHEVRAFREWTRRFNKRSLNPAILSFAGRASNPYAVVHHIGRRSGRAYSTPVSARLMPEGFIIPMPYGSETDWCRNILAAGRCTISWRGSEYSVGEPEVIDLATAVSLVPVPKWRARIWSDLLARTPLSKVSYLRLKRLSVVPERTKEAVASS